MSHSELQSISLGQSQLIGVLPLSSLRIVFDPVSSATSTQHFLPSQLKAPERLILITNMAGKNSIQFAGDLMGHCFCKLQFMGGEKRKQKSLAFRNHRGLKTLACVGMERKEMVSIIPIPFFLLLYQETCHHHTLYESKFGLLSGKE